MKKIFSPSDSVLDAIQGVPSLYGAAVSVFGDGDLQTLRFDDRGEVYAVADDGGTVATETSEPALCWLGDAIRDQGPFLAPSNYWPGTARLAAKRGESLAELVFA